MSAPVNPPEPLAAENRDFGRLLADQIETLAFPRVEAFDVTTARRRKLRGEPKTAELRRGRRTRREAGVQTVTLVDEDGVLKWQTGSVAPSRLRTGRRRAAGQATGRVVQQVKFTALPRNRVDALLQDLDERLTPNQGLREVTKQGKVRQTDHATPARNGRILLFVHGTFSSCENVLEEIHATKEGKALVPWAYSQGGYGQVLAFNHPTLSVPPILNAVTLARTFAGSTAEVDVVCHSRGGLVTRWWLEALDRSPTGRGRVVFVGSPLGGTGLAAPANLKDAIDALTNLARGISIASKVAGAVFPVAAPLTMAVGMLASVVSGVTSVASKTPILDAGIALVPGLNAQSRQGGNAEVLGLRDSFAQLSTADSGRYQARYYAVRSNFESENPGWRFWRHFRRDALLDRATAAIFDGENDLVVDTPSMRELSDDRTFRDDNIKDFGSNAVVHHVNYFQQPATIEFLRRALTR